MPKKKAKPANRSKKMALSLMQDGYLQKLVQDGNLEAWRILFHRDAIRLMVKRKGPETLTCALNEDVWLYFTRHGAQRVSMFIEVREHVTPEKLKLVWSEIAEYRKLLADGQGPWTGGGAGYLFARLAAQEEDLKKLSPKNVHVTLAKQLNQNLERDLRNTEQKFGLHWALSLLRTMQPRGSKKDHEEWCADAIESIARNRRPSWARGIQAYTRPITGQNVRDRLTTWRARLKKVPPHDNAE